MILRLLSDFQYSESCFEACLTLVSLHGPVRVEGWEEYLRLTGEGHPTDGETAKHTLPAHHIDLL